MYLHYLISWQPPPPTHREERECERVRQAWGGAFDNWNAINSLSAKPSSLRVCMHMWSCVRIWVRWRGPKVKCAFVCGWLRAGSTTEQERWDVEDDGSGSDSLHTAPEARLGHVSGSANCQNTNTHAHMPHIRTSRPNAYHNEVNSTNRQMCNSYSHDRQT